MAEVMRALASNNAHELLAMGQRGFNFYKENMIIAKGARQIEKLLSEVVTK
jgi:hypothetical protein